MRQWELEGATEAVLAEAKQKLLDLPSQSIDRDLLIFIKTRNNPVRGEMVVIGSLLFYNGSWKSSSLTPLYFAVTFVGVTI
jgi:hypothetical protein